MSKRPRGRPSLDASGHAASVHVKLAAATYDELYQLAQRRRESVPTTIRRGVQQLLAAEHAARKSDTS